MPTPKTRSAARARTRAADARRDGGDPAAFAPVLRAFAGARDVSPGKMFGAPGLRVGGKVFAMLVGGRLVAKLPAARVDELIAAGRGARFDPGHGRVMREWVAVPAADPAWVELAREAHDFVRAGAR